MKLSKASLALITAGAAAATAFGVGVASADEHTARAENAYAPYARAAAVVKADGTIIRAQGVDSVERISAGKYCVELAERINASEAVPVATLEFAADWRSEIYVYKSAQSTCGDPARFVQVATGMNGQYHDEAFHLIVV